MPLEDLSEIGDELESSMHYLTTWKLDSLLAGFERIDMYGRLHKVPGQWVTVPDPSSPYGQRRLPAAEYYIP